MRFYQLIRPLIFLFKEETAHNLAIKRLRHLPVFKRRKSDKVLKNKICNISFKNPVGMAAGFDKNCDTLNKLFNYNFGFVEFGTVTPRPQIGNEMPRIFRLHKDQAIINALGFNNLGINYFLTNICQVSRKNVFGINIGKNKHSNSDDYLQLMQKTYGHSNYITINISSPNTKGLRDLQERDQLDLFLTKIADQKRQLFNKKRKNVPIFLKIAPDLTVKDQKDIAILAKRHKIDGLIISNTTISRPKSLKSPNQNIKGGLSGRPLFELSTQVLANFYQLTKGQIPLIGVGGISNADDAYKKIRMGASLIQIYSAFIYQGFDLVNEINDGLAKRIRADGYKKISQVIGLDAKKYARL